MLLRTEDGMPQMIRQAALQQASEKVLRREVRAWRDNYRWGKRDEKRRSAA